MHNEANGWWGYPRRFARLATLHARLLETETPLRVLDRDKGRGELSGGWPLVSPAWTSTPTQISATDQETAVELAGGCRARVSSSPPWPPDTPGSRCSRARLTDGELKMPTDLPGSMSETCSPLSGIAHVPTAIGLVNAPQSLAQLLAPGQRAKPTPPMAIRMATASSTPKREIAGAGAAGSGEQMPVLPGPGLSQDSPAGQDASTQHTSSMHWWSSCSKCGLRTFSIVAPEAPPSLTS